MADLHKKAIDLLYSEHLNFFYPGYTSPRKDFKKSKKRNTSFITFIILDSLGKLNGEKKIQVLKKNIYLSVKKQKSRQWSFNYWIRNSPDSEKEAYPDDLDDTFCALSALCSYNSSTISGRVLGYAVSMLTENEQEEGGPYFTWLLHNRVKDDPDLAVNANIAYFLALQNVTLPRLHSFINSLTQSEHLSSQYYASEFPVIYFISRYYNAIHKKNPRLVRYIYSKQKRTILRNNQLDTIFALLSLLNLGVKEKDVMESFKSLRKNINMYGFVKNPFVVEKIEKKKKYFSTTPALNAALFLQLEYKMRREEKEEADTFSTEVRRRLKTRIENRASLLGRDLRKEYLHAFSKVIKDDATSQSDQIVLLPYFFYRSMWNPSVSVSENVFIDLAYASLCGWVAYSLYDDHFDSEGEIKSLSVANVAHRDLSVAFLSIVSNHLFRDFLQAVLDAIDSANQWEIVHCRMPFEKGKIHVRSGDIPSYGDYEKLYERSMGHCLASVALFTITGYEVDSPEVEQLMRFFKNYIIAKQLNDDAHDWERDMGRGIINSVGEKIMRKYLEKTNTKIICGEYDEVLNIFRELFWEDVIEEICADIMQFSGQARKEVSSLGVLKEHRYFNSLVQKNIDSAEIALRDKKKMMDFLKSYK